MKVVEDLELSIIEGILRKQTIPQLVEQLKVSKTLINKVINDNSKVINDAIKEELILSNWLNKLTDDVYENIKIYHYYLASLTLTPEILDLKTKKTYSTLLDLSLTEQFTKSQATALSSLLTYFAKSIEES